MDSLLSPLSLSLSAAVSASHQAVSSPLGALVSDQHLLGGRGEDVVPMVRAERLHLGHVELWLVPGLLLRPHQPAGAAG